MRAKFTRYASKTGQRIDIRIDRWDTYSMDNTLAHIILPMLLQLRDTKHGVPHEFADVGGEDHGQQDSFDFYKETHNESFDAGAKRWEECLDKMIWSFQQLAEGNYGDQYHHGEIDVKWEPTGKTIHNPISGKVEETFQMLDLNPEGHWYDIDGELLHDELIQEGLELFGKYYRHLWD
jgi:hypothetical protein